MILKYKVLLNWIKIWSFFYFFLGSVCVFVCCSMFILCIYVYIVDRFDISGVKKKIYFFLIWF